MQDYAEKQGVTVQHVQPCKPRQQACIGRFNRTDRHERPNRYIIETVDEAQDFATRWPWTSTNDRPNIGIGIGEITPAPKLKMAA